MNEGWLSELSAWLSLHPGWLALALFMTAFVESLAIAGVIVPGVAILFAFAALAGKTGMPIAEALAWAGLGAIAGDVLSFAIGRKLQGRLDAVWPFSRYPYLIAKGESFFLRHGGKSVVIGRFVGPVRPVIPLVAGTLSMPWRRFLTFNIFSAIGWAPVYILPGFLVGSALASEIKPPAHFYPVMGISLAVVALVYLLIIQFQLRLTDGGRLYHWLEGKMAGYDATHRFWRLYTNHRPARAGEFPLASLIMAVGALGLLIIWGQLATQTDVLSPFDEQALLWFQQLRQPLFDGPAITATLLGDTPVLLAGAALACLTLAFRGYYAAALHITGAAVLTFALVWLAKSTLGVVRPDTVVSPPGSGAFPSGHSTGITVFTLLLASFVAAESKPGKRWQVYTLCSLPLIPVALSRLYLGVHWFTDAVGGILLGLAITGMVRASYSRYDRTHLTSEVFTLLAAGVWLAFTIGYMVVNWPDAEASFRPL
ncbi:bifunctional DedA family/phosphatase PAP2 family protein [Marinobacter salinisoli]|uniref:Bifunctional DedA family/phosphatase PAP2 family protein n=1 Tax=Marinobacter salinisoli TaxID=2769486 RepID=A0ABX7MV01_9GAMM|nr:bifunctional DedA family/phosphatase PAP2 family protein [Marinobacter salinisoli]QSP96195.1 bifunctional DedA family/phosphatase PAP2 family protein [Marinobacter salinisoli]